ncbi:hypothetical protein Fmac_013563 [Flemingia macrophylla]|uniref:MHD domain-containing protein n=1 Tax=Flemingia macrophylla TaxID=520843 RepID=A0ABD1MTH4_9FABA
MMGVAVMGSGCSIRAIWILNNLDAVVFSRRFPVVEKRWRASCNAHNDDTDQLFSSLPTDSDLADAFLDRKHREGSARGFGIRKSNSSPGSDSWGLYTILILPLVEPRHLKAYARLCKRPDCGTAVGMDNAFSSLLLDLPSITGALLVAHAIGDIITGDTVEPEVIVSAAPSVGGLFDSLTGSIGISSRAKPVAPPVASSTPSGAAVPGSVNTDAPKIGSRPLDKDALRTFISSSMPFGTPLDLNYSNIVTMKANGFSTTDLPPADHKQPAWKPYLFKGKQRMLFTIHEIVHAALYDRDEIPDTISVSGQINCRADLEGLPDVSFPMSGLNKANLEVLSYHHCAQVSDQGNLCRWTPMKGFYQLSMVSEDKGAFLFKLHLMEGYKAPSTMEFCTVTMPFPRRRIVSLDGTPSVGTVSTSEHSVEWKIVTSGRGLTGKSIEVTFPGTVKFAPWQNQRLSSSRSSFGIIADEDSDNEADNASNMVNEEHLMEKINKDLPPVDLEEPFCWQAYNYAKVSFKLVGASVSGIAVDPKSVSIYPAVKAPVEFSIQCRWYLLMSSIISGHNQVTSGDYILWNTLVFWGQTIESCSRVAN